MKLLLSAGASLAGFTPHVLAEYPGYAFSVTPDKVELEESKSLVLTAQAGRAKKLLWTIKVGKAPFESPAYAFKLTFSGQIPKLR